MSLGAARRNYLASVGLVPRRCVTTATARKVGARSKTDRSVSGRVMLRELLVSASRNETLEKFVSTSPL